MRPISVSRQVAIEGVLFTIDLARKDTGELYVEVKGQDWHTKKESSWTEVKFLDSTQ